MTRLFWLALLAGCTLGAPTIQDLEERARADPKPNLEAALDRSNGPTPPAGPLRAVTLPMVRGKVPTVRGRINGVEMPLIVDTGASHVALSGDAARESEVYLAPREPVTIVSPGYSTPHKLCVFESLDLGGNRFGHGVATISTGVAAGRRWANLGTGTFGIVGASILSHFKATFDFRRREVRLAPHGKPGFIHPLWAEVEVNGKPLRLLVDSGATRPILEPWAALELGLISADRARRHATKAPKESGTLYSRFTLETLSVAGRTFKNVSSAAVQTFGSRPLKDGARAGGLLGLKSLGKLVWTIDYGTRRITVEDGS